MSRGLLAMARLRVLADGLDWPGGYWGVVFSVLMVFLAHKTLIMVRTTMVAAAGEAPEEAGTSTRLGMGAVEAR